MTDHSPALRTWPVVALCAVLVVAVDQASKAAALVLFIEPVPVLPTFALSLSFNTGAAFSMGTSLTPVLTLIAAAVVVFLVLRASRIATQAWAVAAGLVGGGAAGNLVDRLSRPPGFARGAVVDFLEVSWFASFNLADVAISCGAALGILLSLREVPLWRPTSDQAHYRA